MRVSLVLRLMAAVLTVGPAFQGWARPSGRRLSLCELPRRPEGRRQAESLAPLSSEHLFEVVDVVHNGVGALGLKEKHQVEIARVCGRGDADERHASGF